MLRALPLLRNVLRRNSNDLDACAARLVHAEDHGPVQIQMFEPVGYGIAERIRGLNLDELRPIEALQLLSELQKELKRS